MAAGANPAGPSRFQRFEDDDAWSPSLEMAQPDNGIGHEAGNGHAVPAAELTAEGTNGALTGVVVQPQGQQQQKYSEHNGLSRHDLNPFE